MNNNNSKVSVIIPLYNAEKYIGRCIDSVLKQSYTNFELLLIDDGSIDYSGRICDEYAQQDNRIKVYHKENEGVSKARNFGIDHAEGKFISFIDSDDTVYLDYLATALDKIADYDWLAFSNRIRFYDGTACVKELCNKIFTGQEEIEQGLKMLKMGRFGDQSGMPWNKLYRRSILQDNNIRFPVDIWFREDDIFAYCYAQHCKSFVTISDCLYCYTESILGLSYRKRSSEDYRKLSDYIYSFGKEIHDTEFRNRELQRSLEYMFAAFCCDSSSQVFHLVQNRYKQVTAVIGRSNYNRSTSKVLSTLLHFPGFIAYPMLLFFKKIKGQEGTEINY